MESLINKLKKALFFLTIFLLSVNVKAQDYSAIVVAFQKSYAFEVEGKYTDAASAMKAVYDASSYEINLRLGWLYYMSGSYTESITYYQKAITIMPYSIEAKFGVCYPVAALGNWEEVKKQYSAILEKDPNNTSACYKLGMIYYNAGEYEKAYKCFEKIINLFPFNYDGMIMYAWTNYKLGKTREAKILFYKVLMISPNDASALEGLSYIK